MHFLNQEIKTTFTEKRHFKTTKVEEYLDPKVNKFPLDILKAGFPQGVEASKKEAYLADNVFQDTFGKTIEEFYA